jgi:hypothetical protein
MIKNIIINHDYNDIYHIRNDTINELYIYTYLINQQFRDINCYYQYLYVFKIVL